jgi:hypothetical protein
MHAGGRLRGMALLWLPLDDPTIDAMSALARLPWGKSELDTTWGITGWPAPGGEPPSRRVFERYEYAMDVGERRVALQMSFSPDLITGFLTDFAAFCEAAGPDDPDLVDLLHLQGVYSEWQVDAHAGRARFDAVWADGYQRLENRLGAPASSGHRANRWQHAAWRIGSRLLVIAQGEDFGSHGLYDAAYLAAVDYPAEAGLPVGDRLYGLLVGGQARSDDREAVDRDTSTADPSC